MRTVLHAAARRGDRRLRRSGRGARGAGCLGCGWATLALVLTLTLDAALVHRLAAAVRRALALALAARRRRRCSRVYTYLVFMPYSSEVLGFLHVNPANTILGQQEQTFMNSLPLFCRWRGDRRGRPGRAAAISASRRAPTRSCSRPSRDGRGCPLRRRADRPHRRGDGARLPRARAGRDRRVGLRLGPDQRPRTPPTSARERSRDDLAARGLRDHHRRRRRQHGGRQPRRPGGRRALGRAQHRAPEPPAPQPTTATSACSSTTSSCAS